MIDSIVACKVEGPHRPLQGAQQSPGPTVPTSLASRRARRQPHGARLRWALLFASAILLATIGVTFHERAARGSPPEIPSSADSAADPAMFVPEQTVRIRLPEQWHSGSEDPLPPPPGWMAVEFASLGPTMGSSPESEPLQPGDELTMETGRIASHKTGFFQKLAISSAWIPGEGANNVGWIENDVFVTVALPLPSRDFPLLVTTGFDAILVDGPTNPDLPASLYDAYVDFMWLPKLSERWLGILAVAPGIYSDFNSLQDDAFRVKGKALTRVDVIPQRLQLLLGVLYLNRQDVNWLPAGGVIWDPHDDLHIELVFPRPRLAYRFTATGLFEDWFFVGGEFGGDTFSFERAPDVYDRLTYVDWRVFLGIERKRPGGAAHRLELGYVFSRELKFDSTFPDSVSDDTVMVRAGIDF